MKKGLQNYPVYIYYLYNYDTDEVFYVGATKKRDLALTLAYHISLCNKRWGKKNSILSQRCDYIKKHQRSISIELLEVSDYLNSNVRECYYYHYFTRQGFKLIQSDDSFHYNRPAAMTTDQVLDYERRPKGVYVAEGDDLKKVA